jgi:tetratricopeptide (TPR) repeat protein
MHKHKLIFLLIFNCLLSQFLLAQDKERLHQSLISIKTEKADTVRVFLLDKIAWDTSFDNSIAGIEYGKKALALAEEINYEYGIMNTCNTLATIYSDMGDYEQAMELYLRSIGVAEKLNKPKAIARAHVNMAILFGNQNDYRTSVRYLKMAEIYFKSADDKRNLCGVNNLLGQAYQNFPDSIEKVKNAFEYTIQNGPVIDLEISSYANALAGMAAYYNVKGDSVNCDKNILRAIALMDSIQNNYNLSNFFMSYGKILEGRGKLADAESYYLLSLKTAREIILVSNESNALQGLAILYEKQKRYSEALSMLSRYNSLKDSVQTQESLQRQHQLESMYESEKKENEINGLTRDKNLSKLYLFVLAGCLLLLFILAFVLFNRNRVRNRSNVALAEQKSIIEQRNQQITESIEFAKTIQDTLLPSEDGLRNYFSDSFIFYKPKDIVSGDFWWFTEKNNHLILAAADCTGHELLFSLKS